MRSAERRSRTITAGLSVAGASAVAILGLTQATAQLAPAVALAGLGGLVTLAAALVGRRPRPVALGLVLLGTAVVLGTLHEQAGSRAGVLAIAGAVLFCTAEVADRSFGDTRQLEYRPGARRWDPFWILGVAAASAGVSYAAVSAHSLVAGGGPAALAAGTVAAVLVVVLARSALGGRSRPAR